jgi:sugar diacid utilization regulator
MWYISKLVFRGEIYGSVVVLGVQPVPVEIWRLLPFVSNLVVKLLSAEKYNIVFNDSRLYEAIFVDLLLGNVQSDNFFDNRVLSAKLEDAKCFQLLTVPIQDNIRASIGNLKHTFEYLFPGCWVILYDNHLQVLRIATRPLVNSAMLNEKVRDLMCRYTTLVCYSDFFTDLRQIPEVYQRTLRTLKIAKLLHNNGPVISHEEYRFYDMAMSAARYDNNALDGFLCSKVVEIRTYDAKYGTDYFQTLLAFLQSEKSCPLAAKRLFTHRNTVLYRIARMRELFDLDLDSPESWFQLLYSCIVAAYKDEISNGDIKVTSSFSSQ